MKMKKGKGKGKGKGKWKMKRKMKTDPARPRSHDHHQLYSSLRTILYLDQKCLTLLTNDKLLSNFTLPAVYIDTGS